MNLAHHSEVMMRLLKQYAVEHGIYDQVSGLLIVREVLRSGEPDRVTHMAIVGESAPVALITLDCAKQILTDELKSQLTLPGLGVPSA